MAIIRPITAPERSRELGYLGQSLTDLEAQTNQLRDELAALEASGQAHLGETLPEAWTGSWEPGADDWESTDDLLLDAAENETALVPPLAPSIVPPESPPAGPGSPDRSAGANDSAGGSGRVLLSVKTVESWLSDYDAAVARGDHVPGWWERVAVQLYRMVLPPSGEAYVREYADGTIEIILSPGPTSADLAAQGGAIAGPVGAASGARTAGAAAKAAAKEPAEEAAETAIEEATGLPVPVPGRPPGRAESKGSLPSDAPSSTTEPQAPPAQSLTPTETFSQDSAGAPVPPAQPMPPPVEPPARDRNRHPIASDNAPIAEDPRSRTPRETSERPPESAARQRDAESTRTNAEQEERPDPQRPPASPQASGTEPSNATFGERSLGAARHTFHQHLEDEIVSNSGLAKEFPTIESWEVVDVSQPQALINSDPELGPGSVRYYVRVRDTFDGTMYNVSINYDPETDQFGIAKLSSLQP